MSAEARTPQWTPRDSVEAGILACVNADNRLFSKPEEVADAYFSAAQKYDRCDSPPEPHSTASVVSLLLRTGEKEQVEHGIAMATEAVEADKQPGLVRQSLEAVQRRNQTLHRNVRKSSTIGNVALVGSAGAGILAVTNDGSFVAISALAGVFAGFGYTVALVGKMELMQVSQGTKLLEEHYSYLTLQVSAESQLQETQE